MYIVIVVIWDQQAVQVDNYSSKSHYAAGSLSSYSLVSYYPYAADAAIIHHSCYSTTGSMGSYELKRALLFLLPAELQDDNGCANQK